MTKNLRHEAYGRFGRLLGAFENEGLSAYEIVRLFLVAIAALMRGYQITLAEGVDALRRAEAERIELGDSAEKPMEYDRYEASGEIRDEEVFAEAFERLRQVVGEVEESGLDTARLVMTLVGVVGLLLPRYDAEIEDGVALLTELYDALGQAGEDEEAT